MYQSITISTYNLEYVLLNKYIIILATLFILL